MEVAVTPAYHQQDFPRQISAMDKQISLIDRLDEASLKGSEDAETRKYISETGVGQGEEKGSEFIRTGTVKKRGEMKPAETRKYISKRKALAEEIEQYNGRIVVADKMDTLLCFEYMLKGNLGKDRLDEASLKGFEDAETRKYISKRVFKEKKTREEDILDTCLVEVAGGQKRLHKNIADLLKKSKVRHTIAEEKKKRLQDVADRRDRFSVAVALPAPATKPDPRLADMQKEASHLNGIKETKAELTAMLLPTPHGNGDSDISGGKKKDVKKRLQEVADRRDRFSVAVALPAPAPQEYLNVSHSPTASVPIIVESSAGLPLLISTITTTLSPPTVNNTFPTHLSNTYTSPSVGIDGINRPHKDVKKRLQEVADRRDRFSVAVALPAPAPQEYLNVSLSHTASVPAVKGSEFIRTGTVKKRGKVEVALDKMDTLLYFEYMRKANLYELDLQTLFNIGNKGIYTGLAYLHEGFCHIDFKPANVLLDEINMVPKIAEGEQGQQAREVRSCGFGDDGDGGIKFVEETKKEGSTGLAHLMLLLMVEAVCSKICEMSPEEFFEIVVCQDWRTTWKFESSSKQIKRLNQIVLSCLETGKSTKATSSTVSSTQRGVHDILILASRAAISIITEMKPLLAYNITAPNMDSVDLVLDSNGLTLAAALSEHQHNLRGGGGGALRSNRAAATNSSDETTRTPMANKLTDDEAENHSDPNSCVAERDTIEEEKRSGEWFVATGAAHHATWNRDLFSNLVVEVDQNDGLCVHAADGTPMPVCGRGDVVTDDVVLPDVYYVPRLCTNLVSVGQLAGLDYCVGFGRGACVISSAAGTVVGRAHARGDGLYEVDCLRVTLGMP